jgi:hypothetical protein
MRSSRSGNGAALETERPQRPGGCVKNPAALRDAKRLMCIFAGAICNAYFFREALEFLMNSAVDAAELNSSGPPSGLA